MAFYSDFSDVRFPREAGERWPMRRSAMFVIAMSVAAWGVMALMGYLLVG